MTGTKVQITKSKCKKAQISKRSHGFRREFVAVI